MTENLYPKFWVRALLGTTSPDTEEFKLAAPRKHGRTKHNKKKKEEEAGTHLLIQEKKISPVLHGNSRNYLRTVPTLDRNGVV